MLRHRMIAALVAMMVAAGGPASSLARAADPSVEPSGEAASPSSETRPSQPLDETTNRPNEQTLPPPALSEIRQSQPLGETTSRPNEPTLPPPARKLVPVLPPPSAPQPRLPAYQLKWQYDVPFLVLLAIVGTGRAIRSTGAPAYCAVSGCDPNDLNSLDRPYAGQYQPKWDQRGNFAIWGIEIGSLGMLLLDEGVKNGLNDAVVIAESTVASSVAAGIVSPIAGRPRPLVYGTTAPASVRENGTGGLSFFSGHTATVFGAAVSTFVTVHRLHPDRVWPYFFLLGGVALGTFEGYSRVMMGSHFPTDVIAGAAAGSAMGILIPAMHESPHGLALQPVTVLGGGGLALAGRY